jgi:hypothetical protein
VQFLPFLFFSLPPDLNVEEYRPMVACRKLLTSSLLILSRLCLCLEGTRPEMTRPYRLHRHILPLIVISHSSLCDVSFLLSVEQRSKINGVDRSISLCSLNFRVCVFFSYSNNRLRDVSEVCCSLSKGTQSTNLPIIFISPLLSSCRILQFSNASDDHTTTAPALPTPALSTYINAD